MAKYIKLLMVALFATMSFTLTSCGDDDEPYGSNAKGELSIDGTKYTFDIFMGDLDDDGCYDYSCLMYNTNTDAYSLMVAIDDWDEVHQGFVWDEKSAAFDSDCSITVTWFTTSAKIGGLVSGSVKVTALDKKADKITLSFNKAEFEYYDGGDYYNLPSFIVDGTITMPINGSSL